MSRSISADCLLALEYHELTWEPPSPLGLNVCIHFLHTEYTSGLWDDMQELQTGFWYYQNFFTPA